MRKLSSFLLPLAAVGALVGTTLAAASPAAADPYGYGHGYGYGRYERHERIDYGRRFDRYDRYRHEDRRDWGYRHDGWRRDYGYRR